MLLTRTTNDVIIGSLTQTGFTGINRTEIMPKDKKVLVGVVKGVREQSSRSVCVSSCVAHSW